MAVPSEAHLLAFGRIMHNFATVESGIKITLSAMLKINLADAMITFQPYGAQDLKNVAKSIAKECLVPELAEKLCWIIGEWSKHNTLRNSIAHNRWTDGDRPGAIKPRFVSIRQGRADWKGDGATETSYTATELEAAAHDLHGINENLKAFIITSGLHSLIEVKMKPANA